MSEQPAQACRGLEDLAKRLGLNEVSQADPLWFGLEAAFACITRLPERPVGAMNIVAAVFGVMPASATPLERGVAFGLALALATEQA